MLGGQSQLAGKKASEQCSACSSTCMFDWFPGNHGTVQSNRKSHSTMMDFANFTGPTGREEMNVFRHQIYQCGERGLVSPVLLP